MRKALVSACVCFLCVVALKTVIVGQKAAANGEWWTIGGDPGHQRHSPLTQITPQNVTRLERVWSYHTGEVGRDWEATPLMIDNVLYISTSNLRVIALDATTGRELWAFDPKVPRPGEGRGVAYWPGDGTLAPRILLATTDATLFAIDAKTGKPVPTFGTNGVVNMRVGIADKFPKVSMGSTSPVAIYKNLAIVGHASTPETVSTGIPGDPQAFDGVTGKLVWRFRLVPGPGEPGNETWGPPDGWIDRNGPSSWGPFTVDTERGMVFIPTGNAASRFYTAGDRKGTNRFSASIIALDAATGKLKWDFQTVHHDVFDYDVCAPPTLIDVVRDGKKIPAVAQNTKMGIIFILDRETGKPIYGVEERPAPPTDLAGEDIWPTQPFPLKPPQISRNSFKMSEITKISPESTKFCTDLASQYKNDGPYTPFRIGSGTLMCPGTMGGNNWNGHAFDPISGYIIANTSEYCTYGKFVKDEKQVQGPYKSEGGNMRFVDQDSNPCTLPPWGKLTAVNANTGDIAWSVPLGSYDELEAKGFKNYGALNLGGPITTASGLTFIGATNDKKFRAFETRTGKELWMTRIDATANATPMTYMGRDGRQYVVVAAGGPGHTRGGYAGVQVTGVVRFDQADSLIAWALPK